MESFDKSKFIGEDIQSWDHKLRGHAPEPHIVGAGPKPVPSAFICISWLCLRSVPKGSAKGQGERTNQRSVTLSR